MTIFSQRMFHILVTGLQIVSNASVALNLKEKLRLIGHFSAESDSDHLSAHIYKTKE